MKKIALTGNIASGKSLVENQLKSLGASIIDADEVAHKVLEEKLSILKAFFGEKILNQGELNRQNLAKIVFSDKAKKEKLESIIHPVVKEKIDNFLKENNNAIASIPLLFETGWEKDFDVIIFVMAKDNIRQKRLINRNNFSKEEAKKRMKSQLPQLQKANKSDFIIDNNGTKEETFEQVKKIYDNIWM